MKCKLCKNNNLDNVGSHIFTESIIRTALNQEGYTKRDNKEIIFEISADKVGLDYFGSAVQPEVIEEIIWKPISDEIISDNNNVFIDRNLLCRECEIFLSLIESDFVEKVYSKIISKANHEQISQSCNFIEFKGQKLLSLLFVITNTWRASASKYDEWYLKDDQEEYLRSYLNSVKGKDINEILNKANERFGEINSFKFILSYYIQESENLTENGIVIDNSINPYFILLNRLSIIFDFNNIEEKKLPQILPDAIRNSLSCLLDDDQEENIKININLDIDRKELFNKIGLKVADQIIRKLNNTFKEMHRRFLGFNPTQLSVNFYSTEIKKYVEERNEKIEIAEMLKLVAEIIFKIRKSY